MRWPALFVALTIAGCGAPPAPGPGPDAQVTLQELEDGRWRATWTFPEPVTGMRFMRTAHFFREQAWRVVTPGFRLARDGDSQVVVGIEGEARTSTFELEFPVDTRRLLRDYELFIRFTDGSLALYTGHLYTTPLDDDRAVVTTVRIDPGAGRRIVLAGETHDGETVWRDAGSRGTYAYIGDIVPQRLSHMTLVADPGGPPWVAQVASRHLPEILGTLERRMGRALARSPTVLLHHVPGAFEGYASGGGMLDDLLQLGIQGDDWHRPSPWGERHFLLFAAHEAVHLWNGGLARSAVGAPPWMHEGSADALAVRTLHALGLVDDATLRASTEAAFNGCFTSHDGAPLNRTRSNPAHYACGHLVALWTEFVLADAGATTDLFGFWGELIARASARDGTYVVDDYFRVLGAAGVPGETVATMRAFTEAAHPDAITAWRQVFEPHGLRLQRADELADGNAVLQSAYQALSALLSADCDGSSGFYPRGDFVELARLGTCGNAREGMRVDRIGPHVLDAEAFAAARHAREWCAEHGQVSVGLRDGGGELELACPDAWPPLHGYWRLVE